MSQIGSFALYLALYVCVVGVALSVIAGRTGSRRFVIASQFSAYTAFGAIALASSVLMHALLTHDYSIQYVASFSDRSMPLFYLIGAFWGGQAGSLLFWTSVVAVTMVASLFLNRRSHQDFMPWVAAVCMSVLTGLLLILCFGSNPFDAFVVRLDPVVGKGLNPLLQTPKMVVHPPSLLAGLATMTVPYAFAMAALITGNFSNAWVTAARKWILIPWFFLSIGNMLGGMWAYEELGWGGYWAWDPVENAAFFPWLMTSALIHSIMIQERRGMLKRWNVGLMIASFVLTIFGTYITRSGLIQSVHTFAQSDIGDYFLVFLLSITFVSVGMFAWRWNDLKGEQRFDSAASRESAFLFNNWLLLIMTLVVLFGTMWPKIKEGFWGQEVSIGPPWFNRWMVPLGLLLVLLMGVGTIIPWRKTTFKSFKAQFTTPIIATLIATPVILGAYWYGRGVGLGITPTPLEGTYAVLCVAFVLFATASMVTEVARAVSARRKKREETLGEAMLQIVARQRRRYGGYVVHFGILCAFIAFAGNALKIEQDVSLKLGETVQVGDYKLRFDGLEQRPDGSRTLLISKMSVWRGGVEQAPMHPGKAIFGEGKMPTSEIDIRTTPLEDLYVALVSIGPDGKSAAFKVFVAPFTWWFWFGGSILVFGTMICMWPRREDLDSLGLTAAGFARATAALSIMGVLSSAPLALWTLEANTEWGSALRYYRIPTEDAARGAANTDTERAASPRAVPSHELERDAS